MVIEGFEKRRFYDTNASNALKVGLEGERKKKRRKNATISIITALLQMD